MPYPQVQNFLQPIVIPTCVVFILTVSVCLEIIASSEYKLAYILILAATILHFVNIVERSDTIDRSHRRIQQLLFFDTAWYRRSRRYRVLIKSAIQRCNRSEHFAFYGGFVTYDREFLLSLFVRSYNICNWLFYMRTKQG